MTKVDAVLGRLRERDTLVTPGAQYFVDLLDVPSDYTGHAGEVLMVNPGESGLQFSTFIVATGNLTGDSVIGVTGGTNAVLGTGTSLSISSSGLQSLIEGFTTLDLSGVDITLGQVDGDITFLSGTSIDFTNALLKGAFVFDTGTTFDWTNVLWSGDINFDTGSTMNLTNLLISGSIVFDTGTTVDWTNVLWSGDINFDTGTTIDFTNITISNFPSGVTPVIVDGISITGDGTIGNPLVANFPSITDKYVGVDSNDTTPGYLDNKLNIHSNNSSVSVTKTVTNPSGNEILDFNLTVPSQVSDTAYGPTWDGITTIAPSKNAVYDKIFAMDTEISELQDAIGINYDDTFTLNWVVTNGTYARATNFSNIGDTPDYFTDVMYHIISTPSSGGYINTKLYSQKIGTVGQTADWSNFSSIELEFKTGYGAVSGGKYLLIGLGSSNNSFVNVASTDRSILLGRTDDYNVFIKTADGTTASNSTNTASAINNWVHYKLVWENGVSVKLYVNGVLQITKTTNLPISTGDVFIGVGIEQASDYVDMTPIKVRVKYA